MGGIAPTPSTEATPLYPAYFRIEDPSLNWLASESGLSQSIVTTVKYKIDHNSKTKNRTKKNSWMQKLRSENCGSFEINIIVNLFWAKNIWKLRTKSITTQKRKNWNFFSPVFHSFQYVSQLLGPKYQNGSFWEREGHILN